jgi:hypothetical protein
MKIIENVPLNFKLNKKKKQNETNLIEKSYYLNIMNFLYFKNWILDNLEKKNYIFEFEFH